MSKTLRPTTSPPSIDLPSTAPAATPDASSAVAAVSSGAAVTPSNSLLLQPALGNGAIQALLTDQGWLDTVSGAEATTALDQLLALPPEARGQAVDGLDDAAFQALTDSLPEERQRELSDLMSASKDPQRKLDLWSIAHLAEAKAQIEGDMEDPSLFDRSEAASQARHRDDVRDATLDDTGAEVEDEVRHIEERMTRGEKVDPSEIDALAVRKSLELEIETTYGVDLTNTPGSTGLQALLLPDDLVDHGRRTWSFDELLEVEGTLSRVPTEFVRDNPAVQEIKRMEAPTHDLAMNHGAYGNTMEGKIEIYDRAATVYAPTALTGEDGDCAVPDPLRMERTSALAHHAGGVSGPDGELSQMQEALTHELGHAAHLGNPELLNGLEDAAGWEHFDADGLSDWAEGLRGMRPSDEEMAALEATRPAAGVEGPTCADDWCYGVDPYDSEGYLVRPRASIPDYQKVPSMTGEDEDGCRAGAPSWDYARTSPEDHFAELYAKAIQQPEALYRKLVVEPPAAVAAKQQELSMNRYWLQSAAEAGLDEAKIAELQGKVSTGEVELARLQPAVAPQAAEWEFIQKTLNQGSQPTVGAL